MSRIIEPGDLILTENAELEVVSINGNAMMVIDEHDDKFAQDRDMTQLNVQKGKWELHKAVSNQ